MKEDIREKLIAVGVDVEDALSRFMENEELFLKFLGKFLSDDNYNVLLNEIKEQNYEEAFKAAHTLKGVTSNLSIISMYQPLVSIVENLRRREKPEEKMVQSMMEAYEKVKMVIIEL